MNDPSNKALLPAGMHDGLEPEAAQESEAARQLVRSFDAWGYGLVKPPLMEFEDSLLSGNGQAMAAQTFRVQDPVSQRMLALRPDMTLQVARIAHSRLSNAPRPLRLAYSGQVVRVKGSQQRTERQFAQVGAELIGAEGPAADVEVVLMAAEALQNAGVKNLSVDLGLPTLAPTIIDGLDLDGDTLAALNTALERKDAAGVQALADKLGDAAPALNAILDAVGPARAALDKLSAIDLPGAAAEQRDHLKAVVDGILAARPDMVLTLDPVERRGFEYHTGVTFALFAKGVMGELGRGGRYSAGSNGHAEPATGLSLFMDTVMQALPTSEPRKCVCVPFGTAPQVTQDLRNDGWRTVAALTDTTDAEAEARRLGCAHVLDGATVRKLSD